MMRLHFVFGAAYLLDECLAKPDFVVPAVQATEGELLEHDSQCMLQVRSDQATNSQQEEQMERTSEGSVVSSTSSSGGLIVELMVIKGELSACPGTFDKVVSKIGEGDFNPYGGTWIWLCAKYGSSDAITDLYVVTQDGKTTGCGSYLDSSWHRIGQGEGSDGDFNQETGGQYIYLCYRKGGSKAPLTDLSTTKRDCDPGFRRILHTGNHEGGTGDFTQGTGKKDALFLCAKRACVATDVTGHWTTHFTIASVGTETWKVGTTKVSSQTATKEWSSSVSATVTQGWTLLGGDGSVSVTGTIARQSSQSFTTAVTYNKEHDFTVTWGAESVGKTPWQFVFETRDSCDHVLPTPVPELAITEGAFRPPCCVPGYATDAPLYKTCFSKETMVFGGMELYGCSVASS